MDQSRFIARRREFLGFLGDAIAIVPAGVEQVRNGDVTHAFRQDSDFFFLTGFTEPDAIAVFDPGHDTEQYTLFVRGRDPEMEAWNGRRAGTRGATERFGADAAYTIDEFDGWIRQRLVGRTRAAYTLGGKHDSAILKALDAARGHAERVGSTSPDRISDPRTILFEMRLVKSNDEIDALREACRISAVAHTEAMRYAEPGRTERQVQAAVEYVFASMGSERIGYGSIVAGGDNAVILHYIENDMPLNEGDLLLVDAGAEYQHLTADITRTFPIDGRFSAPQRAVYDLVLDAERQIIDMCMPDLPFTDMHTKSVEVLSRGLVDLGLLPGTTDEVIDKGWYRQFFFHGTGHWLGIDVHDPGTHRIGGEGRPLEPGMVFTVEPGIYIPRDKATVSLSHARFDQDDNARLIHELGRDAARIERERRKDEAGKVSFDIPAEFVGIGVRIEDNILVTATGSQNLTVDAPVDPDRIEDVCAQESALPVF